MYIDRRYRNEIYLFERAGDWNDWELSMMALDSGADHMVESVDTFQYSLTRPCFRDH